MTAAHHRLPLSVLVMLLLYRPAVRRAARATLQGRRVDPLRPERGRFLRSDVDRFLRRTWAGVLPLLREDDVRRIPTLGNRHNVFLGALTIAAYHALLELDIAPEHARALFADVGWKIYARLLGIPYSLARVRTAVPQRRVEWVLRALLRFPFSAPGPPGYAVTAWASADAFHTDWTFCAPLGFVRRHVARHGDRGEVEAFYQSWCLYDWAAADLLAGGRSDHPHYRRPRTLSRGDEVCDMCWTARKP